MRQQIVGLDLMRFLAAILVMLYHMLYWRNGNIPPESNIFHSMWRFGWLGVEIFFVISGFVIAYSAHASNAAKFAWSRFFRIYPMVWICATITFIILLISTGLTLEIVKRYISTLVVKPVGGHIDVVYWTLTVELFFYLFVTVILYISGFRSVVRLMIFIGVTSVFFNGVSLFAQQSTGGSNFIYSIRHVSSMHTTRLLLLRHGCFFALGVLLWKRSEEGFVSWHQPLVAFLPLGSIFEVLFTIGVHRAQFPAEQFSNLTIILIWLAAYSLIDLLIRSKINALFQSYGLGRIFRNLGLLTFPIYLLHNEVGLVLKAMFSRLGGGDILAAALAMSVIVLSAWIVCFYVEPWLNNMTRKKLSLLFDGVVRPTP